MQFFFPIPVPKIGNGLSYSCSRSQSSISYSRSPLAPGDTIEQPRDAIVHNLMDMETLADAMTVKKNWDRPQYAILKEMCLDLKRMHYSFRVNRSWSPKKQESDISLFRDQTTGKFRPMSKVEDGTKFPTERSNRRDFPDTKEEFEEKAGEEDQDN